MNLNVSDIFKDSDIRDSQKTIQDLKDALSKNNTLPPLNNISEEGRAIKND